MVSDPKEQAKNGFRAADDRLAAWTATRATLAKLYARFDALAHGGRTDDSSVLHAAIVARLARNQSQAEKAGWTRFTLERDADSGRIRLVGFAPSAAQRTLVPDWTTRDAADAAARHTGEPSSRILRGEAPDAPAPRSAESDMLNPAEQARD